MRMMFNSSVPLNQLGEIPNIVDYVSSVNVQQGNEMIVVNYQYQVLNPWQNVDNELSIHDAREEKKRNKHK